MGRFQGLVIIVPAFNEEKSIGAVVTELLKISSVLVVNDCSTDNTSEVAKAAGAIVYDCPVNGGYENALRAGFVEANRRGFDYFITCDADGQHQSKDVVNVASELIDNKYDLVIGEREKTARLAEKVFALYTAARFSINDPLSRLKGYSKKLYSAQGYFSNYNSIGTQLALFAVENKLNFKTVKIEIKDRMHGSPRFGSLLRAIHELLKHLQNIYLGRKVMSKILAIIPARGGSKRIPRKNVKHFLGKPIISYSIDAALKAKIFSEVMVSTDDLEVAELSKSQGASVPFMRSEKNSNDFAGTAEVIDEVLRCYKEKGQEFDYVCCIYPTAIFIDEEILIKAIIQL